MTRKLAALCMLVAALGCSGSTQTTSTGGSGGTGTGTGSTGGGTTGKGTTTTAVATTTTTTTATTATTTTTNGTTNGTTTTATGGSSSGASCSVAGQGAIACGGLPAVDAGLVAAFVAGSDQFALNLFGAVAGTGNNVFIAPYSVSAAFAMAYAGADSATVAQMAQVFNYPTDPTDLAPAVSELSCALEADGVGPDGGQLDVANAFFGQIDAGFLPSFVSLLATDFGAPLQSVDFTVDGGNTAREAINLWVSQHTECFIPELLKPHDLNSTVPWVLVNAIYFHGLWGNAFFTNNTDTESFTTGAQTTVQTSMMNANPYYAPFIQQGSFQALELRVKDAQIAVDLLLPTATDGLPAFTASLTPALLQTTFANMYTQQVNVKIPKLALDTSIELSKTLLALGLTLPFPPGTGYFTNMLPGASQIVLVRHEGVLQLDEGGLSAAGATAIVGSSGGATGGTGVPMYPTFFATHPFLIVIRDIPTGTILFLGQVNDPTQS